jgi:hypothetical protein
VDLPNNSEATDGVKCAAGTGTPISGGASLGNPLVGIYIDADRPLGDTGTPVGWQFIVSNVSGQDVSLAIYLVCAAPAGSSSGPARRATHARIVKQVITRLPRAARH